MLKIFNFEVLILVLFCTSCVYIEQTECAACSKSVDIQHGAAVSCVIRGGVEFVTLKCDEGYEFEANDAERQYWIDDPFVKEGIRCNGMNL